MELDVDVAIRGLAITGLLVERRKSGWTKVIYGEPDVFPMIHVRFGRPLFQSLTHLFGH